MTYRLRNILIAVGLAAAAALLTTFYVANYKTHVQQSEATVKVFVAKKDIPIGTLGSELAGHSWLGTTDVAQHAVVPGAITDPDQVAKLLTVQPIYAGEQITLRRFANQTEIGVRAQLHGPLRAISVPGSADQVLAGTLKDGDHVDVIAALKVDTCNGCIAVRDVAQNLLVLKAAAVNNHSNVTGGGSSGTNSVILAVSDRREAQKVFFAIKQGDWTLQLRPVANATQPPIDAESALSMFKDGLTPANLNHFNGAGK
jgi:Flp pilus assembly protein CpaB